jgi:UrcA family protein
MLTRSKVSQFLVPAALLLAAAALPGAAQAADAVRTRQITVVASDLDLGTDAGTATLKRRLAQAAKESCGPAESSSLAAQMDYSACVKAAVAEALPKYQAVLAAAASRRQVAATTAAE